MSYRSYLIERNKRWRQACRDRGLDPDLEIENEIRRSIRRNRQRSGGTVIPPRSWISKSLARLFM